MPRIRSLKPEFWDSPSTARASAVARLAYMGMWNWADDAGRGTANLKELEGFIFPNDDIAELSGGRSRNFRDVMSEVSEAYGVVFYTVSGRPFYSIPSWAEHQRNERLAKSKYPGPEEADQPLTRENSDNHGTSDNLRDSAAELPTSSGAGAGEQGNRGTGDSAKAGALALAPPPPGEPSAQTLVAEWIDHCNGGRPPSAVVGQIAKQVNAMLNEGIPYEDIRTGLSLWQQKTLHPSALPSAVHEIRTARPPVSKRQQESDAQLARMMARAKEKESHPA